MASAFSHALAAVALGSLFRIEKPTRKFWLCGMACAILPDIDTLGFALGVPYGSWLGHRGFTHSLLFAFVIGIAVTSVCFRKEVRAGHGVRMAGYLVLATASHGVLDALTNGGLGVAFFSPFDATRYFFPLHPVQVSPINPARFIHGKGFGVLASEGLWLALPFLVWTLVVEFWRYRRRGDMSNVRH